MDAASLKIQSLLTSTILKPKPPSRIQTIDAVSKYTIPKMSDEYVTDFQP